MKRQGWPSRASLMAFAVCIAVLLCLRTPWIAVDPWLNQVAEGLLVMMLVLAMRTKLLSTALLFAVIGPACAWLLDVVEGPMAVVYGATALVMAEVFVRGVRLHPVPRAAVGALAGSVAVALGTALTLIIAREMTPGVALGYAFARQGWHTVAYFAGGLVALYMR